MTTPDAQARTLSKAIEAQQRQQEMARETAREITRDREETLLKESERETE